MRKVLAAVVVLTCLNLISFSFAEKGFAQEPERQGPPRNIVLIGWDGAGRANIHECLARGELPTLKQLSEEGALVEIDIITGATDTKAGWTQILTGYHPEVTGVFSNSRFKDVPEGLSVFERLKQHFGPEFACLAVIGKSGNVGEVRAPFKRKLTDQEAEEILAAQKEARRARQKAQAAEGQKPAGQPRLRPRQIQGQVVEEDGVKFLVFGGSPYFTMHKVCDVWEFGLALDERVGTRAIEVLEKYKDRPFFFFIHFAEVDSQGHKYGENSEQYKAALISNDTWTGKIIAKLKELSLYEHTLVYVTADHGFNEGATGHSYAPYVFLATNDPLVKRGGMRQDIAPTILARFGLDLSKFEPTLDGEPLTQPATKPVLKAPEAPPSQRRAASRPQGQGGIEERPQRQASRRADQRETAQSTAN